MISLRDVVMIRDLKKQGLSNTAITGQLGISRRTVERRLKLGSFKPHEFLRLVMQGYARQIDLGHLALELDAMAAVPTHGLPLFQAHQRPVKTWCPRCQTQGVHSK